MPSKVKMDAETKNMGLVVWKWTQLPAWRHQLKIWANLGKFIKHLIVCAFVLRKEWIYFYVKSDDYSENCSFGPRKRTEIAVWADFLVNSVANSTIV